MSEWKIQVVKVGPLQKHPNADRLMVGKIADYPIIVGSGEFSEGDLAVYVMADSVVPADDPRWEFLKGHLRIKPKRLRGIFSMGILTKAAPGMKEGDDVAEILKIKKYEPPEAAMTGGEAERCPFDFPKYTDIESVRRWPDILKPGEVVKITEKIHGTSARYVYRDGRLWVGSHREIKKDHPDSVYWKAARGYNLEAKLKELPNVAIYGEVYGWVQDLRYGHAQGKVSLAVFDVMDLSQMKYLDDSEAMAVVKQLDLPCVPELFSGPWDAALKALAEGKTNLGGDHVKEGFVVKPVKERFDERIQRVILKFHGEGYLLR